MPPLLALLLAAAQPLPDPVPVTRVLLTPEQVAAELERAGRGGLVRLPLAEFEKRVADVARAQAAAQSPPRLVEARYSARLEGDALVGTGEWKFVHVHDRPGFAPMDALELALRSLRWADDRPALLDRFPNADGTPGEARLLVEGRGRPSAILEWSARGAREGGELRFALRVPAAPIAVLEVDAPADAVPGAAEGGALLTGPFPAGEPGRARWRVAAGGRSRIDLAFRPAGAGDAGAAKTRTRTRVELTPGGATATYEVEWEALHGPIGRLEFAADARLRPLEVRGAGRPVWSRTEGGALSVRLASPQTSGRVEVVAALAPFAGPDAGRWEVPGLPLADAWEAGESLEMRVRPEVQLEDWSPGGFRVVSGDSAADGTLALALEPELTAAGGPPARPSARVRLLGTEVAVRQSAEWAVEADRATLSATLHCDVRRGSLDRLGLLVPAGWSVDDVEVTPADLEARWTPPAAGAPLLEIELQRPLAPGRDNAFRVTLRAPGPRPGAGGRLSLPLPDLLPLGAKSRDAALTVRVNAAFQANLSRRAEGPDPAGEPGVGLLGGGLAVAGLTPVPPAGGSVFRLRYSGVGPETEGRLVLRARPLRLRAACEHTVERLAPSARVRASVRLDPESGSATTVLIGSSVPVLPGADWRVRSGSNRVAESTRLAAGAVLPWTGVLASTHGLDAAARALAVRSLGGPVWRVRFARPVQEPVTLEARLTAVPGSDAVPLAFVAGADPLEGRVALPADAPVAFRGLAPEGGAAAPGGRALAFAPFPLELSTRAAPPVPGAPARATGASLEAWVGPERRWYRFRCRLTGWNRREVGVVLPAGAELLAAAVDGRRAEPAGGEGGAFALPLPAPTAADGGLDLDLVYRTPAPEWSALGREEASPPGLPVPLSDVPVTWRLSPELVPLLASACSVGPVDVPGSSLQAVLRAYLDPPRADAPPAWVAPLEGVASPWAAQKGEARPAGSFGDWLARTAGRAAPVPVVVDARALAGANLTPASPLPATGPASPPVWDPLGLAVVPARGHALITSPRRRALWSASPDGVPEAVSLACAEAVRAGRDASGRYLSLSEWLDAPPEPPAPLDMEALTPADWSTWAGAGGTLWLASRSHLDAAGWLAALALVALAWLRPLGRYRPGRLALLAGTLASGVLALGDTALGAALRPTFAAFLGLSLLVVARSRPRRFAPRALGVGLAILFLGPTSNGADPEAFTVYLLPPGPGEAAPSAVLAPRALLDRLDLLSRQAAPPAHAVVASAHYEGRPADGAALFDATFAIRHEGDGPSRVHLPLAGVQLREALLGGAPALPTRVPGTDIDGSGDRYAFDIAGRGAHALVVRFAVPLTGMAGGEREVRFGVPEVALSRLTFDAPGKSSVLHAASWRGAQKRFPVPNGERLEADIGRARAVQVRWAPEGGRGTATLRVSEACQWEPTPASARLLAVFRYKVSGGSVDRLRVLVPPGLRVGRVDVRADAAGPGDPGSWLGDWRTLPGVGDAWPTLECDLQAPLAGGATLALELLPPGPLGAAPALEFPRAADAAVSDSAVALKLDGGLTLAGVDAPGLADYPAADFDRERWRPGPFARSAGAARAFRRPPNVAAKIVPTLVARRPPVTLDQRLTWRVSPGRAELTAELTWRGDGRPALVEWDAPPALIVGEVAGPAVRTWTRTRGRVQMWLAGPAAEARVQVRGTLALPNGGAADLPILTGVGVAGTRVSIDVRPEDGTALTPIRADGLRAAEPGADGRLSFAGNVADARLTVAVFGPQADAAFRVGHLIRAGARRFEGEARVEAALDGDRPHRFGLELRSSDESLLAGAELVVPPGVSAARRTSAGVVSWELSASTRAGDAPLRLGVRWSGTGREVPRVRVTDADEPGERAPAWLLMVGPECQPGESAGLRAAPGLPPFLADWADALARPGSTLWAARDADWSLRVAPAPARSADARPVLVGPVESEVYWDGARWAYRAWADLAHEPGAALTASGPPGTALDDARLDGVPLTLARGNVSLTLSPVSAARRLALRGYWPNETDPRRPPADAVPRLSADGAVAPFAVLRALVAPPRLRADTPSLPAAAREAWRAEGHLALAEWLAARPPGPSAESASAWVPLWRAERRLRLAELGGESPSPLRARLAEARASVPTGLAAPVTWAAGDLEAGLPPPEPRAAVGEIARWLQRPGESPAPVTLRDDAGRPARDGRLAALLAAGGLAWLGQLLRGGRAWGWHLVLVTVAAGAVLGPLAAAVAALLAGVLAARAGR